MTKPKKSKKRKPRRAAARLMWRVPLSSPGTLAGRAFDAIVMIDADNRVLCAVPAFEMEAPKGAGFAYLSASKLTPVEAGAIAEALQDAARIAAQHQRAKEHRASPEAPRRTFDEVMAASEAARAS
jgi:hypothetical protein